MLNRKRLDYKWLDKDTSQVVYGSYPDIPHESKSLMQSTGMKGVSGQTFYEFDLVVYNPVHGDGEWITQPATGLILWSSEDAGFKVYQLNKDAEYKYECSFGHSYRHNFRFYGHEGIEFSWQDELELIGCVYQEKDFVTQHIDQIVKTLIKWIAMELGGARAIAIDGDLHRITFLLVGEEFRFKGSFEEFQSIANHGSWILRAITGEKWYFGCEYVSFFDWNNKERTYSTDLVYFDMPMPEIPSEKVIA